MYVQRKKKGWFFRFKSETLDSMKARRDMDYSIMWCERGDLNSHESYLSLDFKSSASTDSATLAHGIRFTRHTAKNQALRLIKFTFINFFSIGEIYGKQQCRKYTT